MKVRTTPTRNTMRVVTASTLLLPLGASAGVTEVLGFDDVDAFLYESDAGISHELPDGYGGFNWLPEDTGRMEVKDPNSLPTGYLYGVTSGEQVLYNPSATDFTVSRNERWTFEGAFMTAAWNTGLEVEMIGYRDGELVHQLLVTLGDPIAPEWIDVGFTDIDELFIATSGGVNYGHGGSGTHLVIDDFTYVVPAPGVLALLGLAGLAGRRRRAGA